MLVWEILSLFISSFGITSYCVNINCLNTDVFFCNKSFKSLLSFNEKI